MSLLLDAETRETLQLTQSKWTKRDGRIDYQPRSCILMGTERLLLSHDASSVPGSADCSVLRCATGSGAGETAGNADLLLANYELCGPGDPLLNVTSNPFEVADRKMARLNVMANKLSKTNMPRQLVRHHHVEQLQQHQRHTLSVSSRGRVQWPSFMELSGSMASQELLPICAVNTDWTALESKLLEELVAKASALQIYKPAHGGSNTPAEISNTCRAITRLRISQLQQLRTAVMGEMENERRRRKLLACCLLRSTYEHMCLSHEKERQREREYLRRLRHDNEVLLMQTMVAAGLLW